MTTDQFKAYLLSVPADRRVELEERAAIMEEANRWTAEVAMERAVEEHKSYCRMRNKK